MWPLSLLFLPSTLLPWESHKCQWSQDSTSKGRQQAQCHCTMGLTLHPTADALSKGVAGTGHASAHNLTEGRTHTGKSGRLYGFPRRAALLRICKPLLASRVLIKNLSECLSSWGGLRCPGGALSSGCENTQTIGLVPRKCHLVSSLDALWGEEGDQACVFDAIFIVYLEDANDIQIWFQCTGCLHIPHSNPEASD